MDLRFYEIPETPELKVEVTSCEYGQIERNLIAHIKGFSPDSWQILVHSHGEIKILQLMQIIRFATQAKKLWVHTAEGRYPLSSTVSELEEYLPPHIFVRISQSEIINIKWVERFEVSSSTNIATIFKNQEKTYISRRYIPKVKERLRNISVHSPTA